MSKKKHDSSKITSKGSVVSVIKANTTKKGKIQGRNKHETRIMKGACPHHTINKKGKIVPTLVSDRDNSKYRICRLCGARVEPTTYTKDELSKKLQGAIDVDNNMKFLSVAANSGESMVRFSSELGSMLKLVKKYYRSIAKTVEKREKIKNKNNKKNRGNDSLGSWSY